jgi:hypothetical protein
VTAGNQNPEQIVSGCRSEGGMHAAVLFNCRRCFVGGMAQIFRSVAYSHKPSSLWDLESLLFFHGKHPSYYYTSMKQNCQIDSCKCTDISHLPDSDDDGNGCFLQLRRA